MDYADQHSEFDRFDDPVQTLLRSIISNQQLWDVPDPDDDGDNRVTEALKYHSRPVERPDRRPQEDEDPYIEEVLHDVLGFDEAIPFQEQCWTRLNEMRQARSDEGETHAAMLAAPTGFGKTEGFSGPLFHDLAFNDGEGFGKIAIVYPRNALLEDQLERFLVTLHEMNEEYHANISMGIYNGSVPRYNSRIEDSSLIEDGEFTIAQWTGNDDDDGIPLLWDDDTYTLSAPDGPTFGEETLKLSRQSMLPDDGIVPDILLTTINSLENFALKPNYDIIDEFRTIVFDEVHLYNGIYGSHASRIINNTKEAITKRVDDDIGMLFIGSSATIDQPEQFGSDLFGVESGNISVIQTSPEDKRETEDREHFYFVTSADNVGTSSTFIQQILLFAHALLEERGEDRDRRKALAFIDSVSQVNQRYFQIEDFENENRWQFHNTRPDDWDAVARETPYRTTLPDETRPGHHFIQDDLNTRRTFSDLRLGADEFGNTDLILSTSLLEVGIDIPAIKVISQYRAPWEMSQFVQRIGRASREEDNDAHFLVILDNEGGDRTLFHRADRFLEPEITTPLNVENEILIWIHDQLYLAFDIVYQLRQPPKPSNDVQREQFLESFLNGLLRF